LKQHKSWFDEEYSKLLDKRKQVKLQYLQNSSQTNGDNLNRVRHKTGRTFRNKRQEYLKEKINEIETNSNNKNITSLYRGMTEFNCSRLTGP
jgi:hypothetical protein